MAINLSKGQKIDLRKSSGETLTNFCVGVNWGAIQKKALFGLSTSNQDVDLDLSCIPNYGTGTNYNIPGQSNNDSNAGNNSRSTYNIP